MEIVLGPPTTIGYLKINKELFLFPTSWYLRLGLWLGVSLRVGARVIFNFLRFKYSMLGLQLGLGLGLELKIGNF